MYQHDHRTGGARFEIIHFEQLIVVHAVSWSPGRGAGRTLVGDFGDGWRCGGHRFVSLSNARVIRTSRMVMEVPCFASIGGVLVPKMPQRATERLCSALDLSVRWA